jgi:F-type H+-transporting ATPase subunit gamma
MMSRGSEALRRKINGAKDLSAVVRSMKALAASSIAQYEQSVESLQDYARTAELGLSVCLREMGAMAHAPVKSSTLTRGAIIFGSDQGLVGRFNEVLMEFAARTLRALPGDTCCVWVAGDRMRELVTQAGLPLPTYLTVPHSIEGILPLVDQILIGIETAREKGRVNEIYVFHNQPLASAGYQPVSKRLLPLDAVWQLELTALRWVTRTAPEVIGETGAALQAFIREYLFVLLFQACAQSLASENASRLAAMQRAEENISDVLGGLKRKLHRIRQESIDEELFEVVSGYEALSKRGQPKKTALV